MFKSHLAASVGALVLDGALIHAEHVRNHPAWFHIFDERADPQLGGCKIGIMMGDLVHAGGIASTGCSIDFFPGGVLLTAAADIFSKRRCKHRVSSAGCSAVWGSIVHGLFQKFDCKTSCGNDGESIDRPHSEGTSERSHG